jgi:ribose transport system permease protein
VAALGTDPSETPVPPTPADLHRARRLVVRVGQQTGFWIGVVLVVLVVFFSVTTPGGTFFSVFNLQTLLGDASEILLLASGALIVIVSGGIDLSTGSMMSLAGTVGYLTMSGFGSSDNGWLPISIGIVAGIAAVAVWGAVNGLLIAYLKVPPFVVTLGSLGAALGVARLLLKGGAFASVGPPGLQNFGISKAAGVPTPFVIAAAGAILVGLMLAITRFGEHVYLTGSNEEGARRAGISVRRTKVIVYMLSGTMAGVAGMVDFARFNSVDVSTGHTTELIASIAAVIIGGTSLLGGVGTMPATVVAVFIPVVLNNGLIISGAQPFWQDILVGMILVAAVAFDQWRRSAATTGPRRVRLGIWLGRR